MAQAGYRNKKVVYVQDGFELKNDSVYMITGKPDFDAPSGLVERGVSKIPDDEVGVTEVSAPFFITNKMTGSGVYDTGLYEESPRYYGMDKAKVKKIVERLRSLLVEPYERIHGEGILDHQNLEFWDSYRFTLRHDLVLDGKKPDDLLGAYISLITNNVAPTGQEGNPKYNGAFFMIADKGKVRDVRVERASRRRKVMKKVEELFENDPAYAKNVLAYFGVIDPHIKLSEDDMFFNLEQHIQDPNNLNYIADTIDKLDNERTKNTINIYSQLLEAVKKGKVTKKADKYWFEGTALGATLKQSANMIVTEKDLLFLQDKLVDL